MKHRFFDLLAPDRVIPTSWDEARLASVPNPDKAYNRYAHNRLVTYFVTRWYDSKWDHAKQKMVHRPMMRRRKWSWKGVLYRVHVGNLYVRVYNAAGECVIFRPKWAAGNDKLTHVHKTKQS